MESRNEDYLVFNDLNKDFFRACADGVVEQVDDLLKRGVSPDIYDEDGYTGLMFAADNGHVEVVKRLIAAGADINKRAHIDSDFTSQWAAIHFAASSGHLDVLQVLINEGEAVDAPNGFGMTSLHIVVAYLSTSMICNALSRRIEGIEETLGAELLDEDFEALYDSEQKRYMRVFDFLLEKSANVNAATRQNFTTPLHIAAKNGATAIIDILLNHGANINSKTNEGDTPLLEAVKHVHPEAVEKLLEKGADVNAIRGDAGSRYVADLSKDLSASLDKHPIGGASALYLAAIGTGYPNSYKVAKILLKFGAEVNQRCEATGLTPYEAAIKFGHIKVANLINSFMRLRAVAHGSYAELGRAISFFARGNNVLRDGINEEDMSLRLSQ